MEAARFGFGAATPPAFKFDPTDADIVAHYLLPRALNLPTTYAHAVIDDDPSSLPPWELLRRHGHGGSDHAFFFSGPSATVGRKKNGGRKERAVKDGSGTWRGQRRVEERLTLLRPGPGGVGGEVDVRYKRYNLTFYHAGEESTTSGWVMYEYEITSPPLPGTVLTRVKVTDRGKKDMRQQQAAKAEALLPAVQEPSYNPAVVTSAGEGSSGSQTYGFYGDNGGGTVEPVAYYTPPIYVPEGGGAGEYSSNYDQHQQVLPCGDQLDSSYNPVVMTSAGEGSSGGQTYGFYGDNGGGTVEPAAYYIPPVYVPEGGSAGEYNNNYGQHQQVLPWSDQLDSSYQYHTAGNAAVMCDKGFSGGQTDAPHAAYGSNGRDIGENDFDSLLHDLDAGGDCDELFFDGDIKQELDYDQGPG